MKKLVFLIVLFVPVVVFAQTADPQTTQSNEGLFGFFTWISGWAEDLWQSVSVDAPSALQRLVARIYEFCFVIWLYMEIEGIKFAWGIAKVILSDLAFGSQLNGLLSALPQDIKALLSILRFTDCVEMLVSAHVTRFVLTMV